MGARALLAFRGTYERDAEGMPTHDALLGAIMESDHQANLMTLTRMFHKVHSAK